MASDQPGLGARGWWAILGASCLAILTAAAGKGQASPAAEPGEPRSEAAASSALRARQWVVGVDQGLPPYSFVDRGGEPQGQFVDLVREIGRVMDLDLHLEVGPAEALGEALEAGEVDILIAVSPTDQIAERFLLSLPHTEVVDQVFVRGDGRTLPAGPGLGLERWLSSREVITLESDAAFELLSDLVDEPDWILESSAADVLRRLAAGDGDCAILPRDTGRFLIRSLELSNLRALPFEIDAYERGFSFAVGRDQAMLMEALESGLSIVTQTERYMEIYNRWQDYRGDDRLGRIMAFTLAPLLLLLVLSGAWTAALRRTVARRSQQLEQEMTERRRLEVQVLEARKIESMSILAGGVAHDFNNLLMTILGNVELARSVLEADSPLDGRLAEIDKAGKRAAELTHKMLAYSGKGGTVSEPVDLSTLVERIVRPWKRSHEKGAATGVEIEVEVEVAPRLAVIEGDPSQLSQLVVHLLENAWEAIEARDAEAGFVGKIVVRTGEAHCDRDELRQIYLGEPLAPGDYVFVEVIDNGVGMDEETRNRMFEPFFSTKFTGRGLGLAAASGIVRGHDGGLRVRCAPGDGCAVRVYLPREHSAFDEPVVPPSPGLEAEPWSQAWTGPGDPAASDRPGGGQGGEQGGEHDGGLGVGTDAGPSARPRGAASAARDPARNATSLAAAGPAVAGPPSTEPGPILVVDDEPQVREVITDILGDGGYRVLHARDGQEAVELFGQRPDIRLVLLDATMPRLGGAETYERLRRLRPEIKIIFSSGYDEQQAAARLRGPQLSAFLQKPYTATDLIETVEAILAGEGRRLDSASRS